MIYNDSVSSLPSTLTHSTVSNNSVSRVSLLRCHILWYPVIVYAWSHFSIATFYSTKWFCRQGLPSPLLHSILFSDSVSRASFLRCYILYYLVILWAGPLFSITTFYIIQGFCQQSLSSPLTHSILSNDSVSRASFLRCHILYFPMIV